MPRTLFDDDHKLFRESAAAFVDREILPRREEIREQRRIPKELWRTAGEAGFLGVAVPEQYGGSDVDFRYNAIFNEELSRAGMAYSSSFTIHADVCAPVPHAPDHRGAEAALAAEVLHRRDGHRDRHDRARGRLRPPGR